MLRITNRLFGTTLCLLVLTSAPSAQTNLTAKAGSSPARGTIETDRTRDGLSGPVRRVRTEVAKLTSAGGGQQEGKHVVLEIVSYDLKGNKIENQYFPIAGATLTGKEVYKYDEKGNISEMTLLNTDGSLLSKETYRYEFDFAGNWNKMTTSVAVVDGGRLVFEPTEVTYRSIMYYLDENMLKNVQATPAPAANPPANNASTASVKPDPKTQNSATQNKTALPTLPSATTNANKVAGGGPEARSIDSSQSSSSVDLGLEPPPAAAAEAAPAPRPILKPISGGVLNGTALSLPAPVYPDAAKRMRTSGTVVVDVVLDETGRVVSATASSGPPMLRDAAVQAALKARFSPTKLSGQPVKVSGNINYKFALVP